MSRGRGPRGGRPLPEGANVAYALDVPGLKGAQGVLKRGGRHAGPLHTRLRSGREVSFDPHVQSLVVNF